jgi:hypothetical protein
MANATVLVSLALLHGPIEAQRANSLLDFWTRSGAFPETATAAGFFRWLFSSVAGVVGYPWRYPGTVLFLLALLGGIRLRRRARGFELCCLLLPAIIALAASFFWLWPFSGNQHMVFAAPASLLLVAKGTESIRCWLARRHGHWAWVCPAVLLLPGIFDAVYGIGSPRKKYELRPVLEYVQRNREAADQFIVMDPAAVEFYAGASLRGAPAEPDPQARVWFISIRSGHKADTVSGKNVLDRLSVQRKRVQAIEEYGAVAYLFGPEREGGG